MNNDYSNVTFSMSLPRSRTKWACETLSPFANTEHEPLRHFASIDAFAFGVDQLRAKTPGKPTLYADTTAVFFFDQIAKRFPGARYLFLHRPTDDVIESLRVLDPSLDNYDYIRAQARELDAVKEKVRSMNLMRKSFSFHDLNFMPSVANLISFVTSAYIDPGYCFTMARTNVVADHEMLKSETNPANVRKLFAARRAA